MLPNNEVLKKKKKKKQRVRVYERTRKLTSNSSGQAGATKYCATGL
jgi:hypothetical protein